MMGGAVTRARDPRVLRRHTAEVQRVATVLIDAVEGEDPLRAEGWS